MTLVTFLFEALLISLSGVMAPGPMTAVTLGKGSESPRAGALIAVGHGLVEFPLMFALFYGFGYLLDFSYVTAAIGLMGGIVLLFMAVGMLRSINSVISPSVSSLNSPMTSGVLLTIANPYFLVWWVTVGATLIMRSIGFGVFAFLTFAVLHWLCDFAWCYFLSILSFNGGRFFGHGFQKSMFAFCGVFLLVFGGKFVADAAKVFMG